MASGAQLVNEGLMEWAIAGQANLRYNYQINRGVLRVSMDGTVIRRYGVLVNEPSGVIELHRGRIVRDQYNIIQNDGLIKKVSSGNATLAGIVITGSGRVQVQEGMLQWNGCPLSNATVHVEQGTLYWNGPVTGNSRIGAGNGVVEVNGRCVVRRRSDFDDSAGRSLALDSRRCESGRSKLSVGERRA
jgi:hypothetical protein